MTDLGPFSDVSAAVVASSLYGPDGQGRVVDVTQIRAALKAEHSFLWVGLLDPTPSLIDGIVAQLGLVPELGQDLAAKHRVA